MVLLLHSFTTRSALSSPGIAQAHIITVSSRHLADVAAAAALAAAAADAAAAACSAAAAVSDALGDGAQPFASRALLPMTGPVPQRITGSAVTMPTVVQRQRQ